MKDQVVYILTTKGGGVSRSGDPGGRPKDYFASFDKNEALQQQVQTSKGYTPDIRAELIDADEVLKAVVANLSPIERLVLKANVDKL